MSSSPRYRIAGMIRKVATWIDPQTRGMGWVCFHCGEHFANPNLACAHFGETPKHKPACVLIQERGMLYELREAWKVVYETATRATRAEDRIAQLDGVKASLESALAHWRREADRDAGTIARLKAQTRIFGEVTLCATCGGSGALPGGTVEYPAGGCCPIGHAKDCECRLCLWRRAFYREESRGNALREYLARLEAKRSPDRETRGV